MSINSAHGTSGAAVNPAAPAQASADVPGVTKVAPAAANHVPADAATPVMSNQKIAADVVNQKFGNQSTRVEFQFDAHSGLVWVNVIDKRTGAIVTQIPPAAIRETIDSLDQLGLQLDSKA